MGRSNRSILFYFFGAITSLLLLRTLSINPPSILAYFDFILSFLLCFNNSVYTDDLNLALVFLYSSFKKKTTDRVTQHVHKIKTNRCVFNAKLVV